MSCRSSRPALLLSSALLAGLTVTAAPAASAQAAAAAPDWSGTIAASSEGGVWSTRSFDVAADGAMAATVRWQGSSDLNIGIQDPAGAWTWATTRTAQPETVSVQVPAPGRYRVAVVARTGRATYSVDVDAPQAGPTPRPAPGNDTGQVWGVEQESPGHSWTTAEAVQHAQRFDLITALPGAYRGSTAAMRAANPSLQLLAYMNGGLAQSPQRDTFPASWYLYDAQGQKIRNNWNLWLMDPANPGWVADRAAHCADVIRTSTFDGCFVDNLGAGTLYGPTLSGIPQNPRTGRAYSNADWLKGTVSLVQAVRASTGAPVMVNGVVSGASYFAPGAGSSRQLLEAAGAGLAETFVRTAGMPIGEHRTEAAWKQDVDMLVDAGARGQRVSTLTKTWVDGSAAQKRALHEYALGSFLLADDGKHSFSFSYGKGSDNMRDDLADLRAVGTPTGAYRVSDGAYVRSYTGGTVLVNPGTVPTRTALDGEHRDADGRSVTSVELAPHTAKILQR